MMKKLFAALLVLLMVFSVLNAVVKTRKPVV